MEEGGGIGKRQKEKEDDEETEALAQPKASAFYHLSKSMIIVMVTSELT